MTQIRHHLDRFIDELTPSERRVMVHLGATAEDDGLFSHLLRAVALEIHAQDARDGFVLWEFEADERAEVERIAATLDLPEPPPWHER